MNEKKLPAGFTFAGVASGIKQSGKPDVSLIVTDGPVVAAGVYTRNQIVAAPVILCKSNTPADKIRAVVTNSGNANACTGQQGMQDAVDMCQQVADRIGCNPDQVLVMSTGIIGQPLPMDCVRSGIDQATQELSDTADAFGSASDAICTTDKYRKTSFADIKIGGQAIRIAAMAKGAGMIAPNMATMLAVVLTDASLTPEDAQSVIASAADVSFNHVSVDGHMSTNDTLLLLASGKGKPLSGIERREFSNAVDEVCKDLAKQMVADGEGATHVMSISVSGAEDDQAAEAIARTIASSNLVKTAITGGDPNWGRIVSAAGYAPAKIQPEKVCLQINGNTIYESGAPVAFDAKSVSEQMKSSTEVAICLRVGSGSGSSEFWASDLTTEYVRFNSEYTT